MRQFDKRVLESMAAHWIPPSKELRERIGRKKRLEQERADHERAESIRKYRNTKPKKRRK